MNISELVQTIQQVLAPAIMVSSSALLLLGFQNKFSNLANRFRALNHEKRLLEQKSGRSHSEETRFNNLNQQVEHLMRRATLVKRAVLLTHAAVICFTGTSALIFMNVYLSFQLAHAIVTVFIMGFICLLTASVFLIQETVLFYHIIKIERLS